MKNAQRNWSQRLLAMVLAAALLAALSILPAAGTTPDEGEPELPELKTNSSVLFIGADDFTVNGATGGNEYYSNADAGKLRLRSLAGYEYLYFRVANPSEAASHFEFTYTTGSNWENGNYSALTATKCEYWENDGWTSLDAVKHSFANWEDSRDMFEIPAGKSRIVRVSVTDLGEEVRNPALQVRLRANDGIVFGDIYAGMRETKLSDLPPLNTDGSRLFLRMSEGTRIAAGETGNQFWYNAQVNNYAESDAHIVALTSLDNYEYLYFRLVNRSDSDAKFSFHNWASDSWVMYTGTEYEYRSKEQTEWTKATAQAEAWAWGNEMMVTVPQGFDGTFRIKITDFKNDNSTESLTDELKQAQLRMTGDLLFGDIYATPDASEPELPELKTDRSALFIGSDDFTVNGATGGNEYYSNADAGKLRLRSLAGYEYLYFRLINSSNLTSHFEFTYTTGSDWENCSVLTAAKCEYWENDGWTSLDAVKHSYANWGDSRDMFEVPSGKSWIVRVSVTDLGEEVRKSALQVRVLANDGILPGDIYAGMRETKLSDLPPLNTDGSRLFLRMSEGTRIAAGETGNQFWYNAQVNNYAATDAHIVALTALDNCEYLYFRLVNRSDSEAAFAFYNWTSDSWVMYAGAEYEYRSKEQTEWTKATAQAETWAWGTETMVTVPQGFDGTFRIKVSDFYKIDDPDNRSTVNRSASLTGEFKQVQLRITGDLLFGDIYTTPREENPAPPSDAVRFISVSPGDALEEGASYCFSYHQSDNTLKLETLDGYQYLYFRVWNTAEQDWQLRLVGFDRFDGQFAADECEYQSDDEQTWTTLTAAEYEYGWTGVKRKMWNIPAGFKGILRVRIADLNWVGEAHNQDTLAGRLNHFNVYLTRDELLFGDIYATPSEDEIPALPELKKPTSEVPSEAKQIISQSSAQQRSDGFSLITVYGGDTAPDFQVQEGYTDVYFRVANLSENETQFRLEWFSPVWNCFTAKVCQFQQEGSEHWETLTAEEYEYGWSGVTKEMWMLPPKCNGTVRIRLEDLEYIYGDGMRKDFYGRPNQLSVMCSSSRFRFGDIYVSYTAPGAAAQVPDEVKNNKLDLTEYAAIISDFETYIEDGRVVEDVSFVDDETLWGLHSNNGAKAVSSTLYTANGSMTSLHLTTNGTEDSDITLVGVVANPGQLREKRYAAFHITVPENPVWRNTKYKDEWGNPMFAVYLAFRGSNGYGEEQVNYTFSNAGDVYGTKGVQLLRDGGSETVDGLVNGKYALLPFGFSGWVIWDTSNFYSESSVHMPFSFDLLNNGFVYDIFVSQAGGDGGEVYLDTVFCFNYVDVTPMEFGTGESRVEYFSRNMGWNNETEEEFVYDCFADEDYYWRSNAGGYNPFPSTGERTHIAALWAVVCLLPVLLYTRKRLKKCG